MLGMGIRLAIELRLVGKDAPRQRRSPHGRGAARRCPAVPHRERAAIKDEPASPGDRCGCGRPALPEHDPLECGECRLRRLLVGTRGSGR